MKKVIIIVVVVAYNSLFAQNMDSVFINMRCDTLSTGVFYSKIIPFANLEHFASNVDTTSIKHLRRACNELRKSAIDTNTQFFANSFPIHFFNNEDTSIAIPVGVVYSDFTSIDTNAFHNGKLSKVNNVIQVNHNNTNNVFVNKRVFLSLHSEII